MSPLSFGTFLSGALIDLDGTYFLQLAIFFALFAILHGLLFKPVLAVLDERDEAIDGARRAARELEARAEEKLETFEAEMKKVRAEAAAERERLRQDGLALERELLARSRAEAEEILESGRAELGRRAAEVRRALAEMVPTLASEIADRLLGRRAS